MDGISINITTGERTEFVAVPSVKSLEQLKLDKIKEIESKRDIEVFKNVTALGTVWQADQRSQELLSSAILLSQVGLPLPLVWRDYFNVDLSITSIDQLKTIAGAIVTQTQAAYLKSWQLKAQVATATTETELVLINW